MKPTAALYARGQGVTVGGQVVSIEEFAQRHGYELARDRYFLDQESGADISRPILGQLRQKAAEGAFNVLLCWSPDRLARNRSQQRVLRDEFQQLGIRVIFVSQVDD